jgi:hypothetical protein
MLQWVKAKTGRAHLDIGERSSKSLRVRADHIIVTAWRAHIDGESAETAVEGDVRCSNCQRIFRTMPVSHSEQCA